ncbi:MAG TPA: fibronectin type III domain-containing protein [Planctomycetota bacterium]|nr:fibronectin type III domain-containing protein [Planctomycetota bacterium]
MASPINPRGPRPDILSAGADDMMRALGRTVVRPASVSSVATPAAPTLLTVTAPTSWKNTHSQLILGWKDNSINEVAFEVQRSTDNINFTTVGFSKGVTGTGLGRTYTDHEVTAGVTYYYRVRAVNSGGNSSWSNTVNTAAPYPDRHIFAVVDDVRLASQDAPSISTVADGPRAYSNAFDSFDSFSGGYKTILKLPTPIPLNSDVSGKRARLSLGSSSVVSTVILGAIHGFATWDNGGPTRDIEITIRVRSILTNFTLANCTWNGMSAFSTQFVGQSIVRCSAATRAVVTSQQGAAYSYIREMSIGRSGNVEFTFTFLALPIYGFLIDVKAKTYNYFDDGNMPQILYADFRAGTSKPMLTLSDN